MALVYTALGLSAGGLLLVGLAIAFAVWRRGVAKGAARDPARASIMETRGAWALVAGLGVPGVLLLLVGAFLGLWIAPVSLARDGAVAAFLEAVRRDDAHALRALTEPDARLDDDALRALRSGGFAESESSLGFGDTGCVNGYVGATYVSLRLRNADGEWKVLRAGTDVPECVLVGD